MALPTLTEGLVNALNSTDNGEVVRALGNLLCEIPISEGQDEILKAWEAARLRVGFGVPVVHPSLEPYREHHVAFVNKVKDAICA